ncbi:MAG TPA: MFS transporter [Solirubrobacteraceae bacterium]|jgi:EmrB/QacA subfamily drug resistance transporter|nr:MFS transporter [Solirubrobacteraceae bacterium]
MTDEETTPPPQSAGSEHALDDGGALAGVTVDETEPAEGFTDERAADANGAGAVAEDDGGRVWRLPGSRSTWILVVCCVAQFMVILDLSIVNVALPSIQSALGFSSPELQWVVDAYSITFAGFLMLGGRAADRLGQRRIFVLALTGFALASLLGGLAPERNTLIAARALQGLAGAFMAASSLAIVTSSFPPGPRLHRAIGTWAAMNGLGGAAGVLFGGIITQEISWRWVLLINPPIGIVTVAVAYAVVSNRRHSREGQSFDLAGALTLTIGQMVLVYGVVEAGLQGWEKAIALGPIIGGLALLGAFNVIEARFASFPLVPFREFTRELNVANVIVVLFSAALFPMWFVGSLYLQQVLGLSPLHTGLTFLPMALTIMLVASRAGRLVGRFGVRTVLASGLVLMTAGMLLLAGIGHAGSSITFVMIPGVLVAAGIGLSIVSSTIAATHGAKEGQTGLASGLVNTSRQVGGGLGLAVLITLATQHTSTLIGAGEQVPAALAGGFRLAYLIGAGLTAAALIVTVTMVRGGAPRLTGARRALLPLGVVVVVGAFAVIDYSVGGRHGAPIGQYSTKDTLSFVTEPGLHPPKLIPDVAPATSKLAPGYIFTANFYDLNYPPIDGQSGPLILDSKLQPVWFKPLASENAVAGNLELQSYQGKPALSYWEGYVTNTGATESGEDIVLNQHYQQVAKLRGVDGWKLTLHEFLIVGNDAWVTANKDVPYDLSRFGGAYNGAIDDSAVQEYDLRTGKLLYNWDALDHIPPGDSYATVPTNAFPWDTYHVNSISLEGNNAMLVSMRDTWAAYLVNLRPGKGRGHIIWTLGGRHSSFQIAKGADFQWQHDVKLQPGNVVTMFDDHCCQLTGGGTYVAPSASSRPLTLKLNLANHTTRMLSADVTSNGQSLGIASDYMGSTQPLPNGNTMVGWGSTDFMSEYSPNGTEVLGAVWPGSNLSYRAVIEPWVGLPLTPPVGAARTAGKRTTVYASWNGATRVAAWRVLGASSGAALAAIAHAPRSGFETAIALPHADASYEVQALDSGGAVIGTSRRFNGP